MSYIRNFPTVNYRFGNNERAVAFQNISIYADIIDQLKDEVTTYEDYTILENMRPDQVSQQIYNTTDYYWTFYILNDKLREQGWPLSQADLVEKAKKDFSGTTLVTATNLVNNQLTSTGAIRNKFVIGSTIQGQSSAVTGTIKHINYDLGQVIVEGSKSFTAGETILLSSDVNVSFVATNVTAEHLSIHHYEDANNNYVNLVGSDGVVDITGGASNTAVTQLDRYIKQNDNLKQIKILRPGIAGSIVNALLTAINE
jgi:hypothetical protein